MTMKLKPVAVLCAMALLYGALPAFSQPEPGSSDPAERESLPPGPRMMDRLADKLELSEAQRGQLKEILARYRSGSQGDGFKALHQARTQLESLVRDPSANEQQVLEAARALSTQAEQSALQRHRMSVDIDSILTDAQRQKAKELRAEEAGKTGRFHGRRGGFPHGS